MLGESTRALVEDMGVGILRVVWVDGTKKSQEGVRIKEWVGHYLGTLKRFFIRISC